MFIIFIPPSVLFGHSGKASLSAHQFCAYTDKAAKDMLMPQKKGTRKIRFPVPFLSV
ncbi:hypothetical protein HMPREF2534_02297 [Bacteroides thetaiotaomicron]|nr:hypothetical protein HMPREF2534_02297 [Bacteroides thetaiotaomicron]CAG9925263.1 hypothetical protein BOVA208_2323 [Bacteroides ovatus]